jgi:hypothetical protein
MKKNFQYLSYALGIMVCFTSCKKDETMEEPPQPVATVKYQQADQMGRPAINTVFVTDPNDKNTFNTTIPSQMASGFSAKFKTRLLALNAGYTTNAIRTLMP